MKYGNVRDQVLAYVEPGRESLDSSSLSLLTKARDLATKMSRRLVVVVVGRLNDDAALAVLGQKGVDEVLVVEHPDLEQTNLDLYSSVLADIAREERPRVFLLPHTVVGIELVSLVAGRVVIPPVTNCVDIEPVEDAVRVTRPMFGGTRHATLMISEGYPVVATLQSRRWPGVGSEAREPGVTRYDPATVGGLLTRIKVLSTIQPPKGGIDLTKAEIIVSVGRGIGSKANLGLYQQLAEALGGVLACSRPVADLGWLPEEHLVGMSGTTVKPKVYLACGISGAYQHIVAMQESQAIIAINNDPSAPIFEVAHAGVVADLNQIVPALLEAAKASGLDG